MWFKPNILYILFLWVSTLRQRYAGHFNMWMVGVLVGLLFHLLLPRLSTSPRISLCRVSLHFPMLAFHYDAIFSLNSLFFIIPDHNHIHPGILTVLQYRFRNCKIIALDEMVIESELHVVELELE